MQDPSQSQSTSLSQSARNKLINRLKKSEPNKNLIKNEETDIQWDSIVNSSHRKPFFSPNKPLYNNLSRNSEKKIINSSFSLDNRNKGDLQKKEEYFSKLKKK